MKIEYQGKLLAIHLNEILINMDSRKNTEVSWLSFQGLDELSVEFILAIPLRSAKHVSWAPWLFSAVNPASFMGALENREGLQHWWDRKYADTLYSKVTGVN